MQLTDELIRSNLTPGGTSKRHTLTGGRAMVAVDIPFDHIETEDEWMRDGACRGLTHLFFPPAAERPQARERREAAAKDVCSGCSVRVDCMDFARDHHEYGFWGGESEDERHAAGFRLIAPIGVRARSAS
jgi:WhiB family transcriptional regulator, redox-sensing transcriptional regulator